MYIILLKKLLYMAVMHVLAYTLRNIMSTILLCIGYKNIQHLYSEQLRLYLYRKIFI